MKALKSQYNYFINASISVKLVCLSSLAYCVWLFLPSVQNALGAKTGIALISIFFIATLLDKSFVKQYWNYFLLRILSLLFITAYFGFIYTSSLKDFIIYLPQTFMFFFPILLAYYVKQKGDIKIISGLFTTIIILSLITAIVNIYWLSQYPNTARALGFGDADQDYLKRAMSYGIGGFSFVYGMLMLFTILFGMVFSTKNIWKKLSIIAICTVLFVSILLSKYFIATILSVIAMFIYITWFITKLICKAIKKEYKLKYTVFIIIAICAFAFIFRSAILTLLSSTISNELYNERIDIIRRVIVDFDWDRQYVGRLAQYMDGIKAIIRLPLTGAIYSEFYCISRHSNLLDLFAGMGIIMGTLLSGLVYLSVSNTYYNILKSKNNIIFINSICIFLLLAILNTISFSREAAIIMFTLPLYFDTTINKKVPRSYNEL